MEHRVPHDIGRDNAKKAAMAAFDAYSKEYAEYSPKTTWIGDYNAKVSFSAKGITLEGKVEVREREVAMDLDVPFLLRPFRTRALEVIEREINVWIQKVKRGEL
jgi:hypothetical protein